jgi:hypothetical protein
MRAFGYLVHVTIEIGQFSSHLETNSLLQTLNCSCRAVIASAGIECELLRSLRARGVYDYFIASNGCPSRNREREEATVVAALTKTWKTSR